MQKKMIKVTDENRNVIMDSYVSRILDDMEYDTLYTFAYDMLKDGKFPESWMISGLTNDQLTNQIVDYCPDILEE
jgi:hypothetical protein